MSELSVANTIQQIPIPNNKSDVEAFLDDIFDRALDNTDIKRHQAKAKGLQKRIKGGGNKSNIANIPSALENLKIEDFNEEDDSCSFGTIFSGNDCVKTKHDSSYIIPNRDYEYSKILKTFLKNKPASYGKCLKQENEPKTPRYLTKLEATDSTSALFRSNWNLLSNDYGLFKNNASTSTLSSMKQIPSISSASSKYVSLQTANTDYDPSIASFCNSWFASSSVSIDTLKSLSQFEQECVLVKPNELTSSQKFYVPEDTNKELKDYIDSIGYSLNCENEFSLENFSAKIKGGHVEKKELEETSTNSQPYVLFQTPNSLLNDPSKPMTIPNPNPNFLLQKSDVKNMSNLAHTPYPLIYPPPHAAMHAFVDPSQIAIMQSVYTQLVSFCFRFYFYFLNSLN